MASKFQDDFDFCLKVVGIDGNCLKWMSKSIRNNVDIVQLAIENTRILEIFFRRNTINGEI